MINLINQQSQINQNFKTYPTATLTLSILGTQASGKSTLLNQLFTTQFPVLDTSKSRSRCTKGVWLQNNKDVNIIDTQGFDSADRNQDQKLFQKQMSLLCVVISDIILINVYMNEIGRYCGGHMDVLQAIFIVGQRLVTPQLKKIIYVIRDCTEDADHKILEEQLSREITTLSNQFKNKQLKFTTEFYFMSNFIYQPEAFVQEAKQLLPLISIRKTSIINNYNEQDRVKYIRSLWMKIKDTKNQIDLKSIDDALREHVMERLKSQALALLQKELHKFINYNDVKTFQRYMQLLKSESLDFLTQHRPKHIKQKQLQSYNLKLFQLFQPAALKHFNNVILKNVEEQLEKRLLNQIQKNKQNKKVSHLIFKKKKEVTEIYKRVINSHKQYSLLIRNFNQKMSQIISVQQRKLNHLFSLFETAAEGQLNKIISEQASSLVFKSQAINQKIKFICQQYQYNEWEVDFKQIWERVSYRCLQKIIPRVIQQKSARSVANTAVLSGDQTTNIIAYHTQLQKKVVQFCRDILQFLHQQNTITQPLSQVKEIVRDCLRQKLVIQERRWKVSILLISILLYILYGQFETLLSWSPLKKKTRRFYMRIYFWSSIALLGYSIFKQCNGRWRKPVVQISQ